MREQRFAATGEELLRAGVAPRHVRRILFELDGHMDDLVEELASGELSAEEVEAEASRRLHVAAVVEAARQRTELHSWMRRWPAAAFTVLPLFAYMALFTGGLALIVLGLTFSKDLGLPVESSQVLQQIVSAIMAAIELVLPASVAVTSCTLAASRRAPLSWTVAGAVLVSLLGATTNAQLQLPPLVMKPALGAGIGFSTDELGPPLLRASCTFLMVVLPYMWIKRRQRFRLA